MAAGSADEIRVIAIDWSGAKSATTQRKTIWAADLHHGQYHLTGGRTREQICRWLIEQARATPRMLAGLDFAFSYPAWFVRKNGGDVVNFWNGIAAGNGEAWIAGCSDPFWGRRANPKPPDREWLREHGLRETDREISVNGSHPKSAFQIYYPGAVGTGSLRGIPFLVELRRAGFAVWPFDKVSFPLIVEIYPRLYAGRLRTSDRAQRAQHLVGEGYTGCRKEVLDAAADSPDAFDALISAVGMRQDLRAFLDAPDPVRAIESLEGKIWNPVRRFLQRTRDSVERGEPQDS